MSKRRMRWCLLGGFFAAACFAIFRMIASLAGGSLILATVEEGIIRHEKTVRALFANTEIILTAPIQGEVNLLKEEGRRNKKGEIVARIFPAGVDISRSVREVAVSAPLSGLFFTSLDQLEQVLTPENLMNLKLKDLLAQAEQELQKSAAPSTGTAVGSAGTTAGTTAETTGGKTGWTTAETAAGTKAETTDMKAAPLLVKKYAPIGKIVNNLAPTWMFVYLDTCAGIAEDSVLTFLIGDEEYSGTVMKLSAEPTGAVVCFSQFVNGTVEQRVQDIVWYNRPASKGMLVPVSALCQNGEEANVYTLRQGKVEVKSVEILDVNETQACVKGLSQGDQVIVNPGNGG